MRRALLLLTILTLACCTSAVVAQDDSSRLDAGFIQLKREFTQTISIKGSDLEKMPFANLSDALAVWLYGAYTQGLTLQYVVDGSPVSDVNAYSIYDIDEVVLVQNAAALVNTAGGQRELVIIRTKRGKGPGGIMAAAQSGLVNAREYGYPSGDAVYHNYYLTAWRNLDKVGFGVSGNYLRDVFPDTFLGNKEVTPDNLQRWRLNGYFTWMPNHSNHIELQLNYTPQQDAITIADMHEPGIYPFKDRGYQHFILPRVSWHSDLSSKWSNDLQATYIHSTGKENDFSNEIDQPAGDTTNMEQYYVNNAVASSYHLWVRDHLGYRAMAGKWIIEPSLNATYEHAKEIIQSAETMATTAPNNGNLTPTNYMTEEATAYSLKGDLVVLTPAIDFSYKRILDMRAGVLWDAGHQKGSGGREAFPFASLYLDVLRLANDQNASGLKVFGSYAQRFTPTSQGYTLGDLTNQGNLGGSYYYTGSVYIITPVGQLSYPLAPYTITPVYWVWQAGAAYTGWKDRLTIQYNLERRNFLEFFFVPLPAGGNSVNYEAVFAEWRSTLQHADVRVKILDGEGLRWQTGVNLTLLYNRSRYPFTNYTVFRDKQDVGDDYPGSHSWTGGWVNRIEVKGFIAGLDLLYHVGESMVNPLTGQPQTDTGKINSIIIPNVYFGYRWPLSHGETVEFFVESRGLIRNSHSDLLDERRYYTVGGKLLL
jgi:hypothetical protein